MHWKKLSWDSHGFKLLGDTIMKFKIKVPATTANLGPGFDALGLTLGLWNETMVSTANTQISVSVKGEGANVLVSSEKNLIVRTMQAVAERADQQLPNFSLHCENHIPLGSGMGSSAAAIVTGVMAANQLLGLQWPLEKLVDFATEMEGHPDNVAPALMGGLVVSTKQNEQVIARKLHIHPCAVTIVLPEFHFPTKQARAVLPQHVSMQDAVHNISHAVLVVQAFEKGDFDLLGKVMDDSLHQPYRLPLIPGARDAMQAARDSGAAGVALSGAGPSLAAFSSNRNPYVGESMKRVFESNGIYARVFELTVSDSGAEVVEF
jgi:homoserine kinase